MEILDEKFLRSTAELHREIRAKWSKFVSAHMERDKKILKKWVFACETEKSGTGFVAFCCCQGYLCLKLSGVITPLVLHKFVS